MTMATRTIVGITLLALAGWALFEVFSTPASAERIASFDTSRTCAECHQGVYAEWESSQHAQSWVNPDVRALSNDFANKDCIDCHAPRPILETGIGNRVLPRSVRRAEGVDCIACHLMPSADESAPATVAGTLDRPSAPCSPRIERDLSKPEFCAVCHDQHETVKQWRASAWFEKGIDCLDCHMPYRDGDPSKGRDHRCLGGHDLALARTAVELRAVREGAKIVAEVENVGAGHSFPTDERSRAADVFWRPLTELGEERGEWRHLYRFRSPYRHEVDIPTTLLPANETLRLEIDDADALRSGVEVALYYKLSPYWEDPEHPDPDREARLVQRVEVAP